MQDCEAWIQSLIDESWTEVETGFVIPNSLVIDNQDIWRDTSLRRLMVNGRNPWMDKLKERILAGAI